MKYIPAVDHDQLSFIFERSLRSDKDFERDLSKFILPIRNNRILLIDEPEISLHPSLQRKFFQYLFDSSQYSLYSPHYLLELRFFFRLFILFIAILEFLIAMIFCIKKISYLNHIKKVFLILGDYKIHEH